MRYAKIVNGVVQQIQPNNENGFIEIDESVVCGMIDNGDGTFSNPEKSLDDAKAEQKEIISKAMQDDIAKGFETNLILMDCSIDDMFLLDEGIKYVESKTLTDINVTDKNNQDHIVTIDEAKLMLSELKDNYYTLRLKKRTLQTEIDAKLKVSTVEAVVW